MDEENLVRCRRVSVVLTPLKSSEINKWRPQKKSVKKRRNRWQNGSYRKPRKSSRKLSVSSSNVDENRSETRTPSSIADSIRDIRTDDTRDVGLPIESNEPFPLWKFKRKRPSECSESEGEEPVNKRLSTDQDSNIKSTELKINLPRLSVTPTAGEDQFEDEDSDIDVDSVQDAASLIMDSCEDTTDRVPGYSGVEEEISPLRPEGEDSDDEEFENADPPADPSPDPESMKGDPSDDENESDNDEDLTDLCLMKEPTVLVTKLEDVIESLENNYSFPDKKYLSERHLDIIRAFKYQADSEDSSYYLVMSPDTETTVSKDGSNYEYEEDDEEDEDDEEYEEDEEEDEEDEEEEEEEQEENINDDEDDEIFTASLFGGRRRNRRRISSEGSSCSDIDPLHAEGENQTEKLDTGTEEPQAQEDEIPELELPSNISSTSSPRTPTQLANDAADTSISPETLLMHPLSCEECQETFETAEGVLSHTCAPADCKKTKSKNKAQKQKKRIAPKSTSLDCTLCSQTFENHELLGPHLLSHTPREHEAAFKAAKRQSRKAGPRPDVEVVSSPDSDQEESTEVQRADSIQAGIAIMNEKSKGKASKIAIPVAICPCHVDDLKPTDLTVQIEMVLFCEICQVLFRRNECFEMHYRTNAECNKDRRKGRSPRLFCITCRVVLSNLSDMRKHLEKHVSINRHGTVTFVCNICRVVFFGVGTVFCTHWFNHEKDPMFVASRYSFPKLCISNRGKNPIGKQPGEQYFFVAEYVCRSCKQQFSSDSDLLNHMKDCKGEEKQSSSLKEIPKEPVKKPLTPPSPAPPTSSASPANAPIRESPRKAMHRIKINVLTKSQMLGATSQLPRSRGKLALFRPAQPRPAPQATSPRAPASPQTRLPLLRPKTIHMEKYTDDASMFYIKKWICDICEGIFPTRKALMEEHVAIHFDGTIALEKFNKSVQRVYTCTLCRSEFPTAEAHSSHWLDHHVQQKYWCSACTDSYFDLRTFMRHVVVLCQKQHPTCRVSFMTKEICRLCNVAFNNSGEFAKHNIDYHAVNRIVATRVEENPVVTMTEVSPGSKDQPGTSTKDINALVTRQYSSIAPKKPLGQQSLIFSPAGNPQASGLVLCVQSQGNNEGATSQQANRPVVINIALPNVNNSEKVVSPPKVRALEDPTVQVVLTQSKLSESTLSASLVANLIPVKTMETTRGQNSSTFAVTMRDTTATGGSVTEKNSVLPEQTISSEAINSLIQNQNLIHEATDHNEISSRDSQESTLAVEDMPENSTTSNSDDVQILQVTQSPQKSTTARSDKTAISPEKSSSVPQAPAVDSDIEILSETSAQEERDKNSTAEETPSESVEKTVNPDLCPENSAEMTLLKNVHSKPRGFLRVKNLSELQDENKNGNETRVNNKGGNTLTEHLMAHLKKAKSPTKPSASANGINSDESGGSASSPHVPGRRILPNIPQRGQGSGARKATPLTAKQDHSGGVAKPMNRVTPIPGSNAGMGMSSHYSRPHNSQFYGNVEQPDNTQNTYVCPICPHNYHKTLFNFLTHLSKHQNLPLDVEALVYSLLNEKFPSNKQGHVQGQVANKYNCLVCSRFETNSPGLFRKHFATHSQPMYQNHQNRQVGAATTPGISIGQQLYRCSLCANYQFSTYQELEEHAQTMHANFFNVTERSVCPLCSSIFDSTQALKEHQEIHHTFLCTICMQKFPNGFELGNHYDLHRNGQIGNS
ncbi:uncharacterized protein [Fopius arisanus]|uniref:Uncharacterized protein isoform X2 n=1 Tax=Fopius arisanus TaxID=64838 RepID=A0A9R1T654_9HYME|nr:PREDICTED: uncharacterized protein LOC105266739 isoform X2 [Fopius arisanus]